MRRLAYLAVVLGAALSSVSVGPWARPRFGLGPTWQFAIGLALLLLGIGASAILRDRDR